MDGDWLLAVHEHLHTASLQLVSEDAYLWLARKVPGLSLALPWEPMQRKAFPNGPERTAVDQLIESLQPFWKWQFCKDALARCSESPRGYPLLPAGETRVPPHARWAAAPSVSAATSGVAAIGDASVAEGASIGDVSTAVGEGAEDGEAESGDVDADGDDDTGEDVDEVEEDGADALLMSGMSYW